MKKIIPLLCAATMVSATISDYTEASEPAEAGQSSEVVQTGKEPAVIENPFEVVKELTLEDVIRRGTENSKNLTILQLDLAVRKNSILITKFDKAKVTREIRETRDDLEEAKENGNDFGTRKGYLESIEALEEQLEQLELALKQIETGELKLQLQEEEAKEGVKLLLTSKYTDLLILQKQIDFSKRSLQAAIKNVNKHQLLYNLGRVAQETLLQVKIAQKDAERKLEEQEKNYRQTLADLSLDISISYEPDMVVAPVEFEVASFEKPTDFNSLIENTFTMKDARKNLELAILDRDHVYKEYEEGDATVYEKNNQDYLFQIAEATIDSTSENLRVDIEELYRNGEDSFSLYEEATRQLEIKKKEIDLLNVRYKLGRVSKYDFEEAQLGLEEAQLVVYEAQAQNYLIQQSIEALEKGYVE